MQKRILIIQDISAIGRVSMGVALPILSGCGVITSMLPTALLSTHSGGFKDFSFLDLTDEMHKIIHHWQSVGLQFDAIQTGYLGSSKQVAVVSEALKLAKKDACIIVDPAMADNGKLYSKISEEMVAAMKSLCRQARIILPNLTEACFLADRAYENRYDDPDFVLMLARELHAKLGVPYVIITGVSRTKDLYGAACYNGEKDAITYFEKNRVDDHFYGTGDTFASVLSAAVQNGKTIEESTEIATEFTARTIEMSYEARLPREYGTCFEKNIPWLVKRLGLI